MRNINSTENFITYSKEKYGNDKFKYDQCNYINMRTNVILSCNLNHTFKIIPTNHLSSNSKGGCKECKIINKRYNQETFIKRANELHNNKYNYSLCKFISLKENIEIICKIHGNFIQKAFNHLYGKTGCPKCGKLQSEQSRMLKNNEIIEKINYVNNKCHNNAYKYGSTFRENNILWLEIICNKHGKHIQRFHNHMKGHGCPKCVATCSNVQIQWLEYRKIRDGFIQHSNNLGEYIIPNTKWSVDGFQKETNTVYEFQGDFWHGNPDIYDLNSINKKTKTTFGELFFNTIEKNNILKNMGYNVIEIWENDWKKGITAIKKLQKKFRYKFKP